MNANDSRQFFQVVTTDRGEKIILPSFPWMKRWYESQPDNVIKQCYGADSCLVALPVMAYMDRPCAVYVYPNNNPKNAEICMGYGVAPLPSTYNDLANDFDSHFLTTDKETRETAETDRKEMTFLECAALIQKHIDKEASGE